MKKQLRVLCVCLMCGLLLCSSFSVSAASLPFTDVPEGSWYYDAVEYVYEEGLFAGTSTTTFEPQTPMTRAMLVSILWRQDGMQPFSAKNPFVDVHANQWYTEGVLWAASNGIVSGMGDGRFAPMETITRAQMASVMLRYTAYLGINTNYRADLSVFADGDSVPAWAKEAMSWAVSVGIISGTRIGNHLLLDPFGRATRAQVASIQMRYVENIIKPAQAVVWVDGFVLVCNEDYTSYTVFGADTDTTGTEAVIPAQHAGKPVTGIGPYAFAGCAALERIVIPDTVTDIYDGAFYGCSALKSMAIPRNVVRIGTGVFSGCEALSSISVSAGNLVYHSAGNCLIETSTKTLLSGCQNSVIPNDGSVEKIAEKAFSGCSSFVYLSIPDSVKSIGDAAFENCISLQSIAIPRNVVDIGYSPFYGCSALQSITVDPSNSTYHSSGNCLIETKSCTLLAGCKNSVIPDDASVKCIESLAFAGLQTLQKIVIPAEVTSIGKGVFCYCNELEAISVDPENTAYRSTGNCLIEKRSGILLAGCKNSVIPDDGSVWSIAEAAFAGCSSLTSMLLPDNLTSIGDAAFADCSSLVKIVIPSRIKILGNSVFQNCTALKNVILPDGLLQTGELAFAYCTSLAEITLPSSVVNIGAYAFSNCSSLESILIPGNVQNLGGGAFFGWTPAQSVHFARESAHAAWTDWDYGCEARIFWGCR